MDSQYDPKKVEDKIYELWEKSGFFAPEAHQPQTGNPDKRKSFTIMMPPPNANGLLHMGHAFFVALEDLMVRYHRMKGDKTLWLPGADHAGFETQVVFDKKLEKESRNRFAMSREESWQEIWDFTQLNKKNMENQLKKLGASCDWSREKFTLDKDIIEIVYDTFEKLYEDGLAYRGERVINWCPKHQTALSELETKYVEREDPLYYIKYGPLTLATVRPETKFGDTALAVNPKDKRYQKYIGKEIEAVGISGKLKFKVIADNAVDPKFGTGVVKVTPAHDLADFEIWQRHKDEIPGPINIIDERGRLTDKTGEFSGMKVSEAREKVAEKMKEIGILEKVEPYKHSVATCYKCGNTLEPLLKPQWFIRMTAAPHTQNQKSKIKNQNAGKSLRDGAVNAIKTKKIKIIPQRYEKVFLHWMKNLRDWNISRQITWGIRIPAWYCISCKDVKINPEIKSKWYVVRHGETDWNKEKRYQGHTGTSLNEKGIEQAKSAAEKLKNKNISLIISSDLSRCRETAEIIAKEIGAEIIVDERFRERNGGEWEGLRIDEILKKHGLGNTWPLPQEFNDIKPDGGENWHEVEKRVEEALLHHKGNHSRRNIVIVTHFLPMTIINKKMKGLSQEEAVQSSPKNTEVFEFTISKKPCKCGSDLIEQDPDVFDTWFSSGQWPFATLGYPKNKDFKDFYPTDVMETGWDILFFWVARMVMLGIYRTGKIPFKTIYLHGLVRDKDRQKMSKSKGNVIDPLGVAEVYGADAVRMALIMGSTAGNDPIISEDKIRGYRNFSTKIWNVARFVMMNYDPKITKIKPKFTAADKKNLKELETVKKKVTKKIEDFKFHEAASTIYQYFWHRFADKIIEDSKPRFNSDNLPDKAAAFETNFKILSESIKILHPFMPFITEEIWQALPVLSHTEEPSKNKNLLIIESWNS
ncbi:MAG: class I tRNA ligase family protein [Candidatus Wolfebacteria bacterium]|nr:class I tRNA ligase family protein [Candidatus Wolfebacteria bacterium]